MGPTQISTGDAANAAGVSPDPDHTQPIDDDTGAAAQAAWERIVARIERRLRVIEAAIVELLDRDLDEERRIAAVSEADLLGTWLGQLGVTAAAELARQVRMVLDEDDPGVTSAMTAASLVEDLRTVLAGVIGELDTNRASSRRLLAIGALDALTDSIVWVALAAGFAVTTDPARIPEGASPDVVLVNTVRSSDVGNAHGVAAARTLVRAVCEELPGVPVVVVSEASSLEDRLVLAESATTRLAPDTPPAEVVEELHEALRRLATPASVVAVGVDDSIVERLDGRRLHVWAAADVDAALAQLRNGEARAVLLGERLPGGILPAQLTRLIRAEPATRAAVSAHLVDNPSPSDVARLTSGGADVVAATSVEPGELVELLRAALERRSRLEPAEADATRSASLPWASARVLIERRLVMAVRRDELVSVIVMSCEDPAGIAELHATQDQLAREFRREDVVARWADDRQVVVLQGVGRRTAVRRIGGVLKAVGELEDYCRVGVAEFPYDGRALDELLDSATAVIDRSRIANGPAIAATDWRPEGERGPDVLLVDPDHTLAAVLSSILGRSGLRCEHLNDGMQVMQHLTGPDRHQPPKVLVCEFDVPGVDGLQLLRRLRDNGLLGRFRVLMLAAGLRETQLRQALEMGVVDIIRKPFSPTMFVHRVQRVLDL
ncbi:MAG: response regulator [Acidimicrobiales bacterium]|nr:response regulator [Acidimicrobiales bacterium]